MSKYYSKSLSGERLKRCYDVAPLRIRQYLKEEIKLVRSRICTGDRVLELGCGYGRILHEVKTGPDFIAGIDNSQPNLHWGRKNYIKTDDIFVFCMEALNLGFLDDQFDLVFCIQNGISAFKVDPVLLIHEALRVVQPGGKVLLSSYSEKIWKDRLEWFQVQANSGLIGAIDDNLTRDGTIVCKDGFKATTYNSDDFNQLLSGVGLEYKIFEIDESSIFCEIFA